MSTRSNTRIVTMATVTPSTPAVPVAASLTVLAAGALGLLGYGCQERRQPARTRNHNSHEWRGPPGHQPVALLRRAGSRLPRPGPQDSRCFSLPLGCPPERLR
jgi:hypothetical protein